MDSIERSNRGHREKEIWDETEWIYLWKERLKIEVKSTKGHKWRSFRNRGVGRENWTVSRSSWRWVSTVSNASERCKEMRGSYWRSWGQDVRSHASFESLVSLGWIQGEGKLEWALDVESEVLTVSHICDCYGLNCTPQKATLASQPLVSVNV